MLNLATEYAISKKKLNIAHQLIKKIVILFKINIISVENLRDLKIIN